MPPDSALPVAEAVQPRLSDGGGALPGVAVVVPARNERAHIADVIRSMPAHVEHIVVVDDASTDDTRERALSAGDVRVTLVSHAARTGVGGALATGYRVAFDAGAQVAAVMAGDGQMDPADLDAVLAPVLEGRADYVKGNRLAHPLVTRRMPRLRLLGNTTLSLLTRWATGLSVDDAQCGYTALSRRAYRALPWQRIWRGYGYPNDLLGWLAALDLTVQDVTVSPIYAGENSGVRLRHALLVIPALLLRVMLRRLARTWQAAWGRRATGAGSPTRPDL